MADFHAVVIGAGVIGLAVARELALSGKSVVVLERHEIIGSETSSRNSEVIHAGIYYPAGSLKAQLCVEGRRMLYAFAESRGVPHRRCGKLIVAVEQGEVATLENLQTRAIANGVNSLRMLDGPSAMGLVPGLRVQAALHSPETGIIDSHAFMLQLLAEVEDASGMLALRAPVERVALAPEGFCVRVGGVHDTTIICRQLVVAAGLDTPKVCASFQLTERMTNLGRPHYYAKGHYFRPTRRIPFDRLIYPAPVPGGLGTHATVTLDGSVRFGPDVRWIDQTDYRFESDSGSFYEAIRRWYPDIDKYELVPDYTGIRPKLAKRGEPDADFAIDGEAVHCIPNLVLLQGIESPGLTSAMAIGRRVEQMLR